MRLAVITDIHSNLEALEAVLDDSEAARATSVIALGDTIGYGASPDEVIKLMRRMHIESVLGNHELAFLDSNYLAGFNSKAGKALHKNKKMLSRESEEYIRGFKLNLVRFNCCFVHGLPPDSVTGYVTRTSEITLGRIMDRLPQKLSFAGHTHLMEITELRQGSVIRKRIEKKIVQLDKESRYIINAGSVGQPRDGNWKAKYVIWDSDAGCIEPRYVNYDNVLAAKKIRMVGIFEGYARKLL